MRLPKRSHFTYHPGISKAMALLALLTISIETGSAQNVLIDLPVAPSGFSSASSIFTRPPRKAEAGFSASGTLSSSYDSNVTQGDGSSTAPRESDFILSPGANIIYATEGRHWIFGANYGLNYDQYLEQDDYSGLNQKFSAFAGYRGGRFILTYTNGFDASRGVNRFYSVEGQQPIIETFSYQNILVGRYTLSPKTSIVGTALLQNSDVQTKGYSDTSAFDANLAALWSMSALTDIGPGVRYTLRSGDNQQDRTGIGPTLNLNYQLSTKVAVRSRVGVQFVETDTTSDTAATWSVAMKYQASMLWSANLSLFRDSQADPSRPGVFNNVTTCRFGYQRKVRRLTLNTGINYELNRREQTDEDVPSNDYNYLTFDSSLLIPIISDDTDLILSVRYRDLSAKGDRVSWNGVQSGIGIAKRF